MTGFSARLIGGGTGLCPSSRSLLSSTDLLGGGGEGGCDGVRRGDFRGSTTGVCERLGVLKLWIADAGDEGVTTASALTKAGRSPVGTPFTPLFGGEWGGSTVSDGGSAGLGAIGGGTGRVGDGAALPAGVGGCRLAIASLSLGRIAGMGGGTGGASRVPEGLASRNRTGFGAGAGAAGAGDEVRVEVAVEVSPVGLFKFKPSNLASNDETGLCYGKCGQFSCKANTREAIRAHNRGAIGPFFLRRRVHGYGDSQTARRFSDFMPISPSSTKAPRSGARCYSSNLNSRTSAAETGNERAAAAGPCICKR